MDEKECSMSDLERNRNWIPFQLQPRSSSEDDEELDDDDEPRLQIDLGGSEEESTHRPGNNKINNVPLKKHSTEPPNLQFSQANPLKSLQKLVHNPFLSTQISSAETGDSQGCDPTLVVGSNTKLTVPSRPTSRSGSAINHETQPAHCQDFKALPHLTPRPGAQHRPQGGKPYPETQSRMQHILNRLRVAAKDELNLRKLQELPSEEAENFAKFRRMLGAGITPPFPKNLDSLPVLKPMTSPQHSNFGRDPANKFRLPSSTQTSNTVRLPPALQVISLLDNGGGGDAPRKSNCRRSPPPMVPIDSFSSFRKPLNDDNVVHRLKRLGTVIELERKTPPSFEDEYDDDFDYDDMDEPFPISVDCVLSTEPPVVTISDSKSSSLPPLKPLSVDQASGMIVTRVQPPPPSLIPIGRNHAPQQPQPKFVPILPRVGARQPQLWNLAPKKTTTFKKRKPPKASNKSELSRLAHALVVQPAGSVRNDDGSETELSKVINHFRKANAAEEAKRRAEQVEIIRVEVTSTPAQLVAIEADEEVTPRIAVKEAAKAEEKPKATTAAVAKETFAKDALKSVKVETPAPQPQPEQPRPQSVQPAPAAVQAPSTNRMFEFSSKQAVIHSVMPNGRKLYACSICSAVYHKMYSVKKHYFRSHVNPRFVSEGDVLKFSVPMESINEADNDKRGMFRCSTCRDIFDDKEELKSHLLEHRPTSTDAVSRQYKTDRYRCQGCSLIFHKKKVFTRHLLECDDAAKSQTKAESKRSTQVVDKPPAQEKKDATEKRSDESSGVSLSCLFCELTFKDTNERQKHVLQLHHPKRKQQACSYCTGKKRVFSDLGDLLKHICETHKRKYFGCANCKIRFKTKEELMAHDMESHQAEKANSVKAIAAEEKPKAPVTNNKSGKTFKCSTCFSLFNSASELTRHRKRGHRNVKPKICDTQESKYRNTIVTSTDYETEFYLTVGENVRMNVETHMEGKLETKKPVETKSVTRSSLVHQYEEKERDTELSFQDMYGAENISSRFIRNVSRLHLDTQLTMLKKANLLDKNLHNEIGQQNARNPSLALELSLTPQKTDPASSSADSPAPSTPKTKDVAFTGEWIKGRKYICGACFARFSGFWDLDDHRWTKHPNVWNSHYEFPIEQAPGPEWGMKRLLQSVGVLGKAADNKAVNQVSSTCTNCDKVITPVAEFHKHILECGGDVDWMSTMYTPTRKHKKWRPYCGHRRKKTVPKNRMFLRNIPETPIKLPSMHRGKQKAGDTETIQKMIANLPPKRITRRVFTFDDIDLKGRNRHNTQTSVLTRKRRQRLDPKTSAQIAKTFAMDNFDVVNSMTKKKKSNFSKSPSPSSDVSASSSAKNKIAKSTTTISEIKPESELDLRADEVFDSSSTSTSDTEMSIKDADAKESPPESLPQSPTQSPPETPKSAVEEKTVDEDDEEHVFDLEQIEPADEDTPLVPDSSVILAAMRETMRQTDTLIHKQTFNSKKRKREEAKCKKCGIKLESPNDPCLTCAESSDASVTCRECGFQTSNLATGSNACEKCGAPFMHLWIKPNMKSCRRCDRRIVDKDDSELCDTCSSFIACAKCKSNFVQKSTEILCSDCSSIAQIATQNIISEDDTRAPNDPAMSCCCMCDKEYPKSDSPFCTDCLPYVPKTVESLANNKNTQLQSPEMQVLKEAIKKEKVNCVNCDSHCEDVDPEQGMCRKCYSIWTTLNATLNTIEVIKEEELNETKCCDECNETKTPEVTLQEVCDKCTENNQPTQVESHERRLSSEVGVQVVDVKTEESAAKQTSKVPVIPYPSPSKSPVVFAPPPSKSPVTSNPSSKPPPDMSEGKSSRAPSAHNVLLICKGCYGLFNTVSSYKEHCETCAFRSTRQETTEKKPLLGFAKRCSKGCVEVIQTDSEILENIKNTDGSEIVVSQLSAAVNKKPKLKKASDKSIFDAIDSVVKKFQSPGTPLPPDTDSPTIDSDACVVEEPEEPPLPVSETGSHETVSGDEGTKKRRGITRRKPVDSPTRERNMRTVETELERQLESQKDRKAPTRKKILFSVGAKKILKKSACRGGGAPINSQRKIEKATKKTTSERSSSTPLETRVKSIDEAADSPLIEKMAEETPKADVKTQSEGDEYNFYADEPILPLPTKIPLRKKQPPENVNSVDVEGSTPPRVTKKLSRKKQSVGTAIDSGDGEFRTVPPIRKPLSNVKRRKLTNYRSLGEFNFRTDKSKPPTLKKLPQMKQRVESDISVDDKDSMPPRLTKNLPRKKQRDGIDDNDESLTPPLIKKSSADVRGRKLVRYSHMRLKRSLPAKAKRGSKKTGKTVKQMKQTSKKRRAVDDIIDQGPGEILSSRLRRKSIGVEPRAHFARLKRRRKTKTEKPENVIKEEIELPLHADETRAETQELIPNSADEPATSSGTGKRMCTEKKSISTKTCDSVIGDVVSETSCEGKPKAKAAKRKSGPEVANKKSKSPNNDLGFSITKTGKMVRRTAKARNSNDVAEVTTSEIEEDTSLQPPEPKVRRFSVCELGVNFSNSSSSQSSTSEATTVSSIASQTDSCAATTAPVVPNEDGDFLDLVPSVPPKLQNQGFVNLPEYDVMSCFIKGEPMENENYEQIETKYLVSSSDGQADILQPKMWYSNAIEFLEERSFRSLGSIINHVNELLLSSDVESGSLDQNHFDEFKDYVNIAKQKIMILQQYENEKKLDGLAVDDDDAPVIMDLDEQLNSNTKIKPKCENAVKNSFVSTSKNGKEICGVCDQTFANTNSLQAHIVKDHPGVATDDMKNSKNGRIRSSNKNQQNGVKSKLRCNHCQKVLQTKAEMVAHLKEHLRTFALSKKDNAMLLKKCIAEKFEELLMDKALNNYLRSPEEIINRTGLPLKILAQMSQAKKNHMTGWKAALAHMLEIDPLTSATTSNVDKLFTQENAASTTEISKKNAIITEQIENGEGYPCPMCSQTFELTNQRNRHLIMVHAPRASTHRHLFEPENGLKNETETKSPTKDSGSGIEKANLANVLDSYLLNDSAMDARNNSADEYNGLDSIMNPIAIKKEDESDDYFCTETIDMPVMLSSTELEMVAPFSCTPILNDSCGLNKNGKPCRKKMSKKEMNLPPDLVKRKAEQALRELTISRFQRIN